MIDNTEICILHPSSGVQVSKKIQKLKDQTNLPVVEGFSPEYSFYLVYTDYRLELQYNPSGQQKKPVVLAADFTHGGRVINRVSAASKNSPLAKAAGIRSGIRPSVVDATAGFGGDSLTLAWLGCHVTAIERSPLIYLLLEDAINRAMKHELLSTVVSDKLTLHHGDAALILPHISPQTDTILVDPMYPHTSKSALNKQDMRLLRNIVGDDNDSSALLSVALQCARKRVIVKRPKNAHPIECSIFPHHQVTMKSGRFDVYLIDHL